MRHPFVIASAVALAALVIGPAGAVDSPSADAIFARAKAAWRTRAEVPFVAFNLRERYVWRGRVHDNWWQVAYRDRDQALSLRRTIVAEEESRRLRGASIGINLHVHKGIVRADALDTNRDADAFPILEPQIEPNASFGLVRREHKAALVGRATPLPSADPNAPDAAPSPSPASSGSPNAFATEKPLRELGRIEAVARDYQIALAGTERVRGADTYHLTLTPLRNPRVYRLRDVWVDVESYATVQIAVQGIFEGRPYDDARWTIGYTPIGGRSYVQQIRTDDALRFGLDRVVTGLTFDFVAYDFPTELPAMTFGRML